jgi:hypothetical protein
MVVGGIGGGGGEGVGGETGGSKVKGEGPGWGCGIHAVCTCHRSCGDRAVCQLGMPLWQRLGFAWRVSRRCSNSRAAQNVGKRLKMRLYQ